MAGTISADWIAVEVLQGGTLLQGWAIGAEGEVLAQARGNGGDLESAVLQLAGGWLAQGRATPVLISGAAAGLRAVPCAALSLPLEALPARDPRLDLRLVPGLAQRAPVTGMMRGAETRIAGVLAARPGWDGVICLPGPQTHWAELSAAEVVGFRSYMTAELFGLIAPTLGVGPEDAVDETAFDEALAQGMARPQALAGRLSSLRAEGVLDGPSASAGARLWGLLIGAELAAARGWWLGRDVVIVGEGSLPRLYERALAAQGVGAQQIDAGMATLAGLAQARRLLRDQAAGVSPASGQPLS